MSKNNNYQCEKSASELILLTKVFLQLLCELGYDLPKNIENTKYQSNEQRSRPKLYSGAFSGFWFNCKVEVYTLIITGTTGTIYVDTDKNSWIIQITMICRVISHITISQPGSFIWNFSQTRFNLLTLIISP